MKALKSIFTIAFLFVITLSFAQPPGGGGGGGQRGGQQGPPPVPSTKQVKKMVTEIAEELTLTEEQETTVLKLYTEHFDTVRKKVSGNSRPNREEMESLEADFVKQVKELLSDEQKNKYTAYLKKQKSRRR